MNLILIKLLKNNTYILLYTPTVRGWMMVVEVMIKQLELVLLEQY